MRPQLINLVLTSSTLASTNAIQQRGTLTGNKGSSLQLRHESGLTAWTKALERHTWVSRSALEVKRNPNCPDSKRSIFLWWWLKKNCNPEPEDNGCDDDDDDDGKQCSTSLLSQTPSISQDNPPSTPIYTSVSTTIPSAATTPTGMDMPITSIISPPLPTPSSGGNSSDGPNSTGNPVTQPQSNNKGDGNNSGNKQNDSSDKLRTALGVVGGFLALFLLLLVWYWLVIRPRRRARLGGQHLALAKDADLESHVTVDLRNGLHTPHSGSHDPGSSSDGISSYALSAVPVSAVGSPGPGPAVESAARSLSMPPSPGAGAAAAYPALQRASPATSHADAAYAAPRAAYSQAHDPRTYTPTGSPRGRQAPVFLPSLPPPLQIGSAQHIVHAAPAAATATAMELDGRGAPPRYPEAIATSQGAVTVTIGSTSPTSPLPVSPLSATSPREGLPPSHIIMPAEPPCGAQQQQQPQQGRCKGTRQPSYEAYEPSPLPEVVSPICQLGQTSASLPEYDESAEAALSVGGGGMNSLPGFVSHHHHHRLSEGEEKQVLQQAMSRY
ncbi:hypothetical protein F5Y12DRAFT_240029 [Xylaria sp. FL1777]|nr:hypothetical protein F5Y12DRAFT_240029 [Xylaria sp. FL1777]